MNVRGHALLILLALPAAVTGAAESAVPGEFQIDREAVFEFAEKPTVTREGDRVTVRFASKGFCDATVAIEDARGRIVRHLASGLLGPNAPVPFRKGSKRQTVVWDGKDDQGAYLDHKDRLTVRVSLGLRPRFERTLLWSPHKQRSSLPLLAAAPEGVYVFDGGGVDYIRLFDHDGNYVRTVYPFPAGKLKDVRGLRWQDFPQGYRRALKESAYQQTLLTSGVNDSIHDQLGRTGLAAAALAVHAPAGGGPGRVALAYEHLNRLATDGASPPSPSAPPGRLPLKGPKTGFAIRAVGYGTYGRTPTVIGPSSLAFSPDGKTLYLTGFLWKQRSGHSGCLHAVLRMDYAGQAEPTVFVGSRDRKKFGRGSDQLAVPTSVACDSRGRVYVSDYLNDRVQVFDPAGKPVGSIRTARPAKVMVHQRTGEVFVLSWVPFGVPGDAWRAYSFDPKTVPAALTRFRAFPGFKRISTEPFPLGPAGSSHVFQMGQLYSIELDSWAPGPEPALWLVGRVFVPSRADHRLLYLDRRKILGHDKWAGGVRLMRKKAGKWAPAASFGARATQKVKRIAPISHNIQQLYVNPADGKLYVGEADSGPTIKAYRRLIQIDPASGGIRFRKLPFNALDVAFDRDGLIYLRTTDVVVRYDPRTWREVPWDYGEELESVTCGIYGTSSPAAGGLVMPTVSPVCFHQGGMSVSVAGHLAVACSNRPKSRSTHHDFEIFGKERRYGKPYRPQMYPGREESSTSCCVHIWDKHGKLVGEDAVPGLPQLDGVGIDRDNNLYVMATPARMLGGKKYFNYMSETLMKFPAGRGKVTQSSRRAPIPLPESMYPDRPADLYKSSARLWADGAEWFYGGVGYAGFNNPHAGGGCACWFARFSLDYFARSFAPEPDQYSVAVLDSGGNLITRIGRYGNVDDGRPLNPAGGPARTRPLGGDEVALFHANFVGVHTDRRLFIADLGNARILSVRLDYHTTERVGVKGAGAPKRPR